MKRILAPCFACALTAQTPSIYRGPQVWEDGHTVLTSLDPDLPSLSHNYKSVLTLDSQGRVVDKLLLPEPLQWPFVSHWRGRSFAYGFPTHPAWYFPYLVKHAWRFPPITFDKAYQNAEQHLYQSTDFRTWQLLARYRPGEDSHGKMQNPVPLEDGSFLGFAFWSFWEGDRVSPVARYRVDGRGHLVFERLVELGQNGVFDTIPHPTRIGQKSLKAKPGYEDIERNQWVTARTREGLVLFSRGGWYFVLDNHDGHCLREGRIPAPQGQTLWIVDAEPGPDGRILVASTNLRGKEKVLVSSFNQPQASPSTRLARELVQLKGRGRLQVDLEGPTPLAWHRLDPATGQLSRELPPKGVTTVLEDFWDRLIFRFTIRPDGNLDVFRERAVWQRLSL